MSSDPPLLPPDSDFPGARKFLRDRKCNAWPAGEGKLVHGLITKRELENAGPTARAVRDLLKTDSYPYVHSDHPLSFALERMRHANVDVLPVVSRANIHEISGVITITQILTGSEVAGTGETE
jgi:CIC family chloride channel protein